jgi:DNA-binding IclR family transcriptional regulator
LYRIVVKKGEMEKEAGGIQVIARAASILRALGYEGMSLGVLAKKTGLPRSTVQRIVDALAMESFVEAGDGGVRLGWGLGQLAALAHSDVVTLARPYLEVLSRATSESVDVSFRNGRDVAFLDRIISEQELRVVPMSNKPSPLHAMANGKAILACMHDDEVVMLLSDGLRRLTEKTISSVPMLLTELAAIRADGFAYDWEEHALGVCAVGVAITVPGLQPHAVSVAVPTPRFAMHLPAIKQALLKAKSGIEAALRGVQAPAHAVGATKTSP